MGFGYNDIYVLAPERSAQFALQFLDLFLPERQASAADYPFPQYADVPSVILTKPVDAFTYAEEHTHEKQAMYFQNTNAGDPIHGMVFFTGDGGMILGISVPAEQDDRELEAFKINYWLNKLREATTATEGYALHESYPAYDTVTEFLNQVDLVTKPKLQDGRILIPDSGEFDGPVCFH
ncbi:MAG: hypothetical protein R3B84_14955 [Zavarzinella sp.]